MAGLLSHFDSLNETEPYQQEILSSPKYNAMAEVGKQLVTSAMKQKRDAALLKAKEMQLTYNQTRDNKKDEQHKEQMKYDAEDRAATAGYRKEQLKYDAEDRAATAGYRKEQMKYEAEDRAATADYRKQEGLLKRDRFNRDKKEFRIEQANKARDRKGGMGKLNPRDKSKLDSYNKDIEHYNKLIEEGVQIPNEVRQNYEAARQWKSDNGFGPAYQKPDADKIKYDAILKSKGKKVADAWLSRKQGGAVNKPEIPVPPPKPAFKTASEAADALSRENQDLLSERLKRENLEIQTRKDEIQTRKDKRRLSSETRQNKKIKMGEAEKLNSMLDTGNIIRMAQERGKDAVIADLEKVWPSVPESTKRLIESQIATLKSMR